MDLQLDGRRTLVTGSSGGIGTGVARMLAEEGCSVVVHGRNRERAEQVAAEIGAAGIAIGDLATDEGGDKVFAEARAALGGSIEILVNNAGGGNGTDSYNRSALDVNTAEWLASYENNTLSSVRMILHAVPEMVAAGWGRVIQISSATAAQPHNLGPDYSGAKASLNNLTVSLAGSLSGAGVTVNFIASGLIATEGMVEATREMYGDSGLTDDEIQKHMATEVMKLPVARLGTPEDIGLVVCMLASPRAGYITGANYRVDGGQVKSVN